MEKVYKAEELKKMPTIATGQAFDLKVESDGLRVFLCRCGTEDGMPYDDAISIEKLKNGNWVETEMYRG